MSDTLYLELFNSGNVAECPLETFIVICVYKYCDIPQVPIIFTVTNSFGRHCVRFEIDQVNHTVVNKNDLPWEVASCRLPVLITKNTVITGSCAVSRQLCKYRKPITAFSEHPEGLLGFRNGCLQAPNEVSIWTKFCEIEILETTKNIIQNNSNEISSSFEIPLSLSRFEKHLLQPLRIHNIFKVVADIENTIKQNETKKPYFEENADLESSKALPKSSPRMHVKHRKWKPSNNLSGIKASKQIQNLKLKHHFSEGPFLTLADVILYSHYFLMFAILNIENLQKDLVETIKWFKTIHSLEDFKILNDFLNSSVKYCNFNVHGEIKYKIPVTHNVSLYKCDPKRSNPRKRIFTKEGDITAALSLVVENMELNLTEPKEDNLNKIDWTSIPAAANPLGGHLPDKRKEKKRHQLENLALSVLNIAKDHNKIVDFCSGSGHLGILLAYLLPKCTIILLENKEESLNRAKERVVNLKITNVYFFQCNLDFFIGTFDIGVALHACGIATDLVLENCINKNASFVVCPCCYGSLHVTERIHYPRSKAFSSFPLDKYMCIGHAADQTHSDHPLEVRGARCMSIIDSDRAQYAMNNGYTVQLSRLIPLSCTPKNMLIVGIAGDCHTNIR